MKIDRPPKDAPDEAWQDYIVKIHECVEEGREENRAAHRDTIQRSENTANIIRGGNRTNQINLDLNKVSLGVLVTILGAILTLGWQAAQWTANVNDKLTVLSSLQTDGKERSRRLTTFDDRLNNVDTHLIVIDKKLDMIARGRRE